MENSMIEKLDSLRSRLLVWTTAGFAVWYGMTILTDFTSVVAVKVIATFLGLIASIVWMVTLIKMMRLSKSVQKDRHLSNALNDELFLQNKSKAFEAGFWALMGVVVLLLILSFYIVIPALLVCKIILYVGVLSFLIAAIVYNRG